MYVVLLSKYGIHHVNGEISKTRSLSARRHAYKNHRPTAIAVSCSSAASSLSKKQKPNLKDISNSPQSRRRRTLKTPNDSSSAQPNTADTAASTITRSNDSTNLPIMTMLLLWPTTSHSINKSRSLRRALALIKYRRFWMSHHNLHLLLNLTRTDFLDQRLSSMKKSLKILRR